MCFNLLLLNFCICGRCGSSKQVEMCSGQRSTKPRFMHKTKLEERKCNILIETRSYVWAFKLNFVYYNFTAVGRTVLTLLRTESHCYNCFGVCPASCSLGKIEPLKLKQSVISLSEQRNGFPVKILPP